MSIRALQVRPSDADGRPTVVDLDEGDLGDGELLVDVEWSTVNYKDAMAARPGNKVARLDPLVPGVDLAGTVAESADPTVAAGTAVVVHGYGLGVSHHGGFATRARVPAAWAVPLPAGLSTRQAMVIGTAGYTAYESVQRLHHAGLEPGSGPVLVTGATGGVGSAAVGLLAAAGHEVVASSGKAAEHDYLRRLGAVEVVGRDDLAVAEGRVLGPERWAGAVDCVGGATLSAVLRTLRYGAAVAASGLTGGTELATTVYPFIIRGVSLLGVDSVEVPIERRRAVWAALADAFGPALLEQLDGGEVTLEALAGVLDDVLAARTKGRVLVRPAG